MRGIHGLIKTAFCHTYIGLIHFPRRFFCTKFIYIFIMFARDRPTHICVLLMIVNEISNWGKIKKWLTYYCQNICWFYWWLIDFGFTNSIQIKGDPKKVYTEKLM